MEFIARSLNVTWKVSGHVSIDRMRVALALHHYFFPSNFKPKSESKKKPTKYGDFSNDQLFDMAKKNKISWVASDNDQINRMRVIMALKAANILEK